jgi:hypothetical protein
MTRVIAGPRIDVKDKGCVEEGPVDCIPGQWPAFTAGNAMFFGQLGSPAPRDR